MIFEVLVDRTEKPNKCTILPQATHPRMRVSRFARGEAIPKLASELLLHPEGVSLEQFKGVQTVNSIAAVDCRWKRLAPIVGHIVGPLPVKVSIPPGFMTAYPRVNKKNLDPDQGLATIEAIFIAGAFLGCWDETLLSRYHFADEFLRCNHKAFQEFGLI